MRTLPAVLAIGVLLSLTGCNRKIDPRMNEAFLWTLEDEYVAGLRAKDIDALETFYHPEFIGWPSHSESPVDLAGSRESLEELMRDLTIVSLEMERKASRVSGGTAMTHYTLTLVQELPEGGESTSVFRITHTWLSTRDGWKILGGMSSS